jgi:DnaJ homolog subfamily C member 9
LLAAYTSAKGDLAKVYESVMLSDVLEDDERFLKIIREEIE